MPALKRGERPGWYRGLNRSKIVQDFCGLSAFLCYLPAPLKMVRWKLGENRGNFNVEIERDDEKERFKKADFA